MGNGIRSMIEEQTIVVGVDEAGRGPVIGDMFVAMVAVDEGNIPKLRSIGVRDSKALTREQREQVFGMILEVAKGVVVVRASPSEIDSYNLNKLFIDKVCKGLQKLLKILRPRSFVRIFIDSAGDPAKVKNEVFRRLQRIYPSIEVVAEHGADAKYEIVGAASIVAKVLRDRHIDFLHLQYGDFGSGYPSDPKTIRWLKEYYDKHRSLPPIVRKSWSTLEKVLGIKIPKHGYSKTLFDYMSR